MASMIQVNSYCPRCIVHQGFQVKRKNWHWRDNKSIIAQLSRPIKGTSRMRMLRVHRIMNRINMRRRLPVMAGIMCPMTGGSCTVELMMLLRSGRYIRNLHRRRHGIVIGRQYASGASTWRGSLRGTLHPPADSCALALVGLAVAEALRERVTSDLQLGYPVVLVSSHRGESGLGEEERLKVLHVRIRR